MNLINLTLLALPVVFVIHSLSELFLLKPWLKKNSLSIDKNNTLLTKGTFLILKKLSYKSIAFIALEELLIISSVTAYGLVSENYYPWIGILCGFFFQQLIHIANWMAYKRYIPSIITSFIGTIYCIYAFDFSVYSCNLSILYLISFGALGTTFWFLNLYLLVHFNLKTHYTLKAIENSQDTVHE